MTYKKITIKILIILMLIMVSCTLPNTNQTGNSGDNKININIFLDRELIKKLEDKLVIFGPKEYRIDKKGKVEYIENFKLETIYKKYRIKIENGNDEGNEVNKGVIIINKEIIDINNNLKTITKDIELKNNNDITIKLQGKENSFIKVIIEGFFLH